MKVQIEDNLYIESDTYSFQLTQYLGVDKNGNEMKRTIGYFPTVEACINKVIDMKIKQSTAKTLKELREDVKEIREYVKSKIDF